MKNKFFMGLLSVAIAFVLWLYVVMVVSPEAEDVYENIPVVMDGTAALERNNLMIVSDTDLQVKLKLTGNRQDLNKLSNSNITVLADLSQITQAGEHNVKYNISYPGTVQSGTIEVQEKSPQYITVVVAERSKKTIKVDVDYIGDVPENFIAHNATLDHATVTITGPKDEIDEIHHAKIIIDRTGRTTDIEGTYRYTLCNAEGAPIENTRHISASATEIRAGVKIDQIKKIKLVYDILPGGGIDESMVTVTPVEEEYTWIVVSGSQAALSKLDHIYLGAIDLSKQTQSGRVTFAIELPEGVENFSGFWTVSYDVEIPVLETRPFRVSNANFELRNVPEGVEVDFISEECSVWLRGTAEELNRLSVENIRVIVDYAAQSTITINRYNKLVVTFVVLDAEGNVITTVGAVPPPDNEGHVYILYAHVKMR